MLTQNQIGVLYMVGSVICFSIMDICVKWLDYYPVGQVLFLRFFIGFIPIFFIIPDPSSPNPEGNGKGYKPVL